MHNDTTLNMDNGTVTEFTLLELSADFDNIKHTIFVDGRPLLDSVSGVALSWFTCYHSGIHQLIKTGDCFSAPLHISCGVLLGAVLVP